MEPDWTKAIPSKFICDWFYVFFILSAVGLGLSIVFFAILMFSAKGLSRVFLTSQMISSLIYILITGTSTLFYYLICDRALLGTGK